MIEGRTFDRLQEFDERSRSFPIRALVGVADRPRDYTWSCPTWLDQGREGACVGFAWAHEAAATPHRIPTKHSDALGIYRRAQQLDAWPGEGYSGTSVIAGAKAALERGWLREYRWAFGIDDALVAISRFGPAVLGVDWYEGMFEPDGRGYIHTEGEILGGHAILAIGVSLKRKAVRVHNSWGRRWGSDGRAWLPFADFEGLLRAHGEVCVPVVRR